VSKLTNRQRAFIEAYLACWNGTEAARRAGYSPRTANEQASRLLANVSLKEQIAARIRELKATADEVLVRLASHSRGSMADFLIGERLSVEQARERGQLHLIKKYKVTRRIEPKRGDEEPFTIETVELELYDAQAATVQLGRALSLFVDRQEITGAGGGAIEVKALDYRTGLTALAPGPIRNSDAPSTNESAGDGPALG
jgi:phage terminase small subunit